MHKFSSLKLNDTIVSLLLVPKFSLGIPFGIRVFSSVLNQFLSIIYVWKVKSSWPNYTWTIAFILFTIEVNTTIK